MIGKGPEIGLHHLQLLTSALDNVVETIFLMGDNSPKFIHVNQSAVDTLGYSREELTGGMGVFDIDPGWDPEAWAEWWRKFEGPGTSIFESEHRTKDGHLFPVEITANRFEFGGQVYNLAICRDITERRRVEEAQRKTEERFRALVENWPDEICLYDQNCRRMYVNPVMEDSLGASRELLDRTPTETFPNSQVIAFYEQKVREVLETGEPATFDMGWEAPAVQPKFRSLRLMPEHDAQGKVTGVFAIARDISEHKRAEDQLRFSEERLKEAQQLARIGSWVWIPGGTLLWSDTMFELFDIPRDVEPNMDLFLETVHPDQREETQRGFQEWIESDEVSKEVEYDLLLAGGIVRTIAAKGKKERDEQGNILRAFGTCQDLTERKRVEEELRKANAQIAEIMESITDAFLTLDRSWCFTYINDRAVQNAGMTREEMLGKCLWDLFPDLIGATGYDELRQAMVDRQPTQYEIYVPSIQMWFQSYAYPTREGISVYSADITGRKRAEGELARVNRALRMLSDSNQALIFIPDEATLLQRVCDIVVDVGGYRMAWVGFVEEEGETVRALAHAGTGETWTDEPSERPVATAIRTGEPHIARNILGNPNSPKGWKKDAELRGYRSAIVLPLAGDGQPFGALCVYSDEDEAFDAQEVDILTELAGDLAFGLRAMQTRAKRDLAEAALRRQMRMDEAMFNQAIACFALISRDYRFINVNESYATYYGKKAEDFEGASIFDVRSAGQSVEEAKAMVDHVVETKAPLVHFAYAYEFTDQPERGITYWDATLQPIFGENDEVEFLFFSSIDVTERERSMQQVRALVEHSPDIIARFDRQSKYVYVNDAIERIVGISPSDLIGRRYGELLSKRTPLTDPREIGAMRKAIASVFETGVPCEIEVRQPIQGQARHFNIRLIPEFDGIGNVASALSVCRDITDRKQAEEALRSVLRHARTIVMRSVVTAPEGWDEHGPEWSAGRYVWDSWFEDEATAQKVLPLDLGSGKSFGRLWHDAKYREDEAAMHLVAARAFVTKASNWNQEFRVLDRFGKVHWFTQAASVEPVSDGLWRVTTINTDITERKLAEEQVRANMARIHLQETALIALTRNEILKDGDLLASIQRLTDVAAKALGVARVSFWRYDAERKLIRCVDLYELNEDRHSDGFELAAVDYPVYFRELEQCEVIAADNALKNPQTREFKQNYLIPLGIGSMLDVPIKLRDRLDGVLCHEHIGPPRQWTSDERTFAVAIANFITLVLEEWERRQAQAELKESQQAYASLVNTVDGIVWELDVASFCFTFVSEQAERLFGYPIERWLTENTFWQDHLHPDDRDWAIHYCLSATHEMRDHEFEYRMIGANGQVVWLHDVVTVVVENGRPVKLRGIMLDITDRKIAEEERHNLENQLRQAQKIEALGTLAGGIAHDFNNIIGTILGNVELAAQDANGNPALLASLEQIRTAGHRARDLTQQILLFGRQQLTSRRVISLKPVIEQCVSLLRATLPARVNVQYEVAEDAPNVLADPSQMLQVLVNLGTNAAQATQGQPGLIEIKVEAVTLTETSARRNPDLHAGPYARVSVTDTGCGMDAATQLRIFEPFFTTKQVGEGTGLGLSVVHGIISSHDGGIVVHSGLGMGSTFELYLPTVQSGIVEVYEDPPKEDLDGTGQNILCIDDDEPLLYLLKRMLERRGYRVSGYVHLHEALDAFQADPESFDAVVTDYNMPGLSGLDVVRIVHEIRPDLPVAVASGYITEELRDQANAIGVTELIFKPNAVEEYCDVIARLVRTSTTA